MNYKGFIAKVEYDEDAEVFFGHVVNTKDTITFQSENAHELKKEFRISVDEYVSWCKERGEAPEKPFSGKFILRVDPELHQQIALQASMAGESMNAFITENLKQIAHAH